MIRFTRLLFCSIGLFAAWHATGPIAHAQVTTEITGGAQFYMDENSAVRGVSDLEQSLYQAQLAGEFSVTFAGLKPGNYHVTVGNTELIGSGANAADAFKNYRLFTIAANGKAVMTDLNLIEKFGPAAKADVTFPVDASEGKIRIDLTPKPGYAPARMSFIRIFDSTGSLVVEEKALSRKPKNWSAPEHAYVQLPDNFQAFPKKNPASVYPELKLYDKSGRPWRVAKEDWEGARQRLANDPAWQDWVTAQRTSVDKWIARHHDRVQWIAGWYHDFVSPRDGSFIEWTENIPGEQDPFLHSRSDSKITITPKIMGGWICIFRREHALRMQAAARLYRLTGEKQYAEWAAQQLDYYADHFKEWPLSNRGDGARLYWQTLDEATALTLYTDTARLLQAYVTPERLKKWKDNFFYPEVSLLQATATQTGSIGRIHNIATWHRCAVAQVALLFKDDALWKEAIDGEYGLRQQFLYGVTADYIWWEQSFGYNNYLVEATLALFESAGIQGRAEELANEMATAENIMLSLTYLRFPDGSVPVPADATSRVRAPDEKLFASAYRVFPTALGLNLAASKRGWNTLIDPPTLATPTNLPEVKSHNFESTRMAVLKSGPWQIFMHYGQLTGSHAQAELLNFSAFYNNIDITHDPGTVGYGSPLHAGYYTRGLNHNVPLIDGEGAYILPQKGEVKAFSDNPPIITVAHAKYRVGIGATRTLQIEGETLHDTISLHVDDGSTHALGFALHLQGQAKLPASFVPDASFAIGRPDSFSHWSDVKKATLRDKAEFDVVFGSTTLHLTIRTPGEFTLWQASTPDVPPRRRTGFYIEKNSADTTFETTLSPIAPKND